MRNCMFFWTLILLGFSIFGGFSDGFREAKTWISGIFPMIFLYQFRSLCLEVKKPLQERDAILWP